MRIKVIRAFARGVLRDFSLPMLVFFSVHLHSVVDALAASRERLLFDVVMNRRKLRAELAHLLAFGLDVCFPPLHIVNQVDNATFVAAALASHRYRPLRAG